MGPFFPSPWNLDPVPRHRLPVDRPFSSGFLVFSGAPALKIELIEIGLRDRSVVFLPACRWCVTFYFGRAFLLPLFASSGVTITQM